MGLTAFSYLAGLENSEITTLAEACYPKSLQAYEITEKLKGEQATTGAYLGLERTGKGHPALAATAAANAIADPYVVCGSTHIYEDGTCILCGEDEPAADDGLKITGFAENRLFQDWITPQRWYIAFTTSIKIQEGEPAVVLGNNYRISVNGEEKTAQFYKEVDGDLVLFIPATMVPGNPPEGTTVTIPAQQITEGYELSKDYTIVYVGNMWKELQVLSPVALTSVQRTDVFITLHDNLAALYGKVGAAYRLNGANSTSGIYCNGDLVSPSIEYSQWGGLYFSSHTIKGTAFTVGDSIAMKGLFTTTVNPNVCYQVDETYTCTAIGATNPNNNLTQATWTRTQGR